jgi:hypothetical protein
MWGLKALGCGARAVHAEVERCKDQTLQGSMDSRRRCGKRGDDRLRLPVRIGKAGFGNGTDGDGFRRRGSDRRIRRRNRSAHRAARQVCRRILPSRSWWPFTCGRQRPPCRPNIMERSGPLPATAAIAIGRTLGKRSATRD